MSARKKSRGKETLAYGVPSSSDRPTRLTVPLEVKGRATPSLPELVLALLDGTLDPLESGRILGRAVRSRRRLPRNHYILHIARSLREYNPAWGPSRIASEIERCWHDLQLTDDERFRTVTLPSHRTLRRIVANALR